MNATISSRCRKTLSVGAALAVALATSGCIVVDDHEDFEPHHDAPVYTTIDADHLLTTDLGLGAGLFVEYASGGYWTLWTSCDTDVTGSLCYWEANVTARASSIDEVYEWDTEDHDHVDLYGSNGLTFIADTASHTDSVEFRTDPGALVEIEVFLDDYLAPEYFVWYGNGFVHDGTDISPVVFQPDLP